MELDLKAEARRLAEEACIELDLPSLDDYAHLPTIQSALLTFGRLVREEDAKAKLYLDCEWNDWLGGLISMALVGEDGREWYEVVGCSDPSPWVAENVMPHLGKAAISSKALRESLAKFLSQYESVIIITDWPEDIAHFCAVVVFEPGIRISTPDLYFHCWRSLEGKSTLPHNALEDARANMLAAAAIRAKALE